MTVQREKVLCRYHYDPLDRVAGCAALGEQSIQRFYRADHLATEIQGQVRHSIFGQGMQSLAQQRHEASRIDTALLATDLQRSVLHAVNGGLHERMVYAPHGHRSPRDGPRSLTGFNGERRDPVTGHYLLGNGYRAFNPVLMRFNSPDNWSPFGKGGVNAYVYCEGNPVGRLDPDGHVWTYVFKYVERAAGVAKKIAGAGANKSAGPAPRPQSRSLIEVLDLERPEASDLKALHHASEKLKEAKSTLTTAQEKFAVLERFVDYPPRHKDGRISVDNFNPADIVNHPDYQQLQLAEGMFRDAQTDFVRVSAAYFARYPRDVNLHAALIRDKKERRRSL